MALAFAAFMLLEWPGREDHLAHAPHA